MNEQKKLTISSPPVYFISQPYELTSNDICGSFRKDSLKVKALVH